MHMISGPIIAIELRGIEAIKKWRDLIGPVDAAVAKDRNPNLLRAKYGVNDIKNGLHGSDSPEAVSRVSVSIFVAIKNVKIKVSSTKKRNIHNKSVSLCKVKKTRSIGFS